MGKLKMTVNEEKTRICKVPEGEFDFLGYTFGRMSSARTGQARIGYRPSKKSIQRPGAGLLDRVELAVLQILDPGREPVAQQMAEAEHNGSWR